MAGFEHLAAIELDKSACETLRINRSSWNVIEANVNEFCVKDYVGVDLFAGGVPCPPFSIAGKQLGHLDERDLFPAALRMIKECNPKAVLLENVRGLSSARFAEYRSKILGTLSELGYKADWRVINASDFAVPQLRPRFILVAIKAEFAPYFRWSKPLSKQVNVGDVLVDLMKSNGWQGAEEWALKAKSIAPTIVGGSKKHGGADLGPTRAKSKWKELHVDGRGIADFAPTNEHAKEHMPRLTLRMAARIQGFPDEWQFAGKKTAAYRQIGNAFPPPVANAIGLAIKNALNKKKLEGNDDELFTLV